MAKGTSRTVFFGSGRHAMFFFIIYIVGAVLLTFAKRFNDPEFIPNLIKPEFIIILTAITLMAIYVIFVTLIPATKLRTDVAADNVYYLGFLYTLTSLAIALAIDETDNILSNFGVAIVSTLIGIVARVCLNQSRVDPTDIEEASRLELADATRRVRAELDETVRQFSDFRQLSLQVLTEGYEEVNKNVESISKKVQTSIEELVEQSSNQINTFIEQTNRVNSEAANSIANVTKSNQELTKSHDSMVEQIKQVNRVLSDLAEHYANTGKIENNIIETIQVRLTNLQNNLMAKSKEGLSGLKKTLEDTNNQSAELAKQELGELKKSLAEASQRSTELTREGLSDLKKTLEDTNNQSAELAKQELGELKKSLAEASQRSTELTREGLSGLKKTLEDTNNQSAELAKQELGELKKSLAEASQRSTELTREGLSGLKKTLEDTNNQSAELAKQELGELKKSLAETSQRSKEMHEELKRIRQVNKLDKTDDPNERRSRLLFWQR